MSYYLPYQNNLKHPLVLNPSLFVSFVDAYPEVFYDGYRLDMNKNEDIGRLRGEGEAESFRMRKNRFNGAICRLSLNGP